MCQYPDKKRIMVFTDNKDERIRLDIGRLCVVMFGLDIPIARIIPRPETLNKTTPDN